MSGASRLAGIAGAATLLAATICQPHAQGAPPPGFVYLRDTDPSIAQDMRYAGSDNFTGRPLPGYEAAECIVRRDVAAALKRVQAELAAGGLSLIVFGCFRSRPVARDSTACVVDGPCAD